MSPGRHGCGIDVVNATLGCPVYGTYGSCEQGEEGGDAVVNGSGTRGVVVVAGYFRGDRKIRTAAAKAPPVDDGPESIQTGWDEKAARTDSWIWR
jgi:hypothetical protein